MAHPEVMSRVYRHELDADALGYRKEVHVYTPPGYDEEVPHYPTIYIQDGRDYIEFAHTPAVLRRPDFDRR